MADAIVTTAKKDQPDYKSQAYLRMEPDWQTCLDVKQGTRHMRAKGELYLPKGPAESANAYSRRLLKSELFNGFGRTVKGLTGMVFRRDPDLGDDMPEQLAKDWEDIDGAGHHGAVFARTVFDDALTTGIAGILVDYPPVPDAANLTVKDVEERNLRPYWVHYSGPQIYSARPERDGARLILSQLVLKEDYYELDGEFGEKQVCRYRVFKRTKTVAGPVVTYQVWEEQQTPQGKKLVAGPVSTVSNQVEIPFAPVLAGEKVGFMETRPPLLDLAYTNISHWQVQSERRYSLHLSSLPILCFKGREQTQEGEQTEQVISPEVGIDVSEGGDVFYAEPTGAAHAATRDELRDLETRMAAQGLAMLQSDTRAAETAEAKRIDKAEQDSTLASAARGLGDALEQAFGFHARYLKLEAGSVEVNQEFEHLTFDAGMIAALSNLQVANQISLDTLWAMLETGGILPDSFDADIEKAAIATAVEAAVAQAKEIAGTDQNANDQNANDNPPPGNA